MIYTRRKIISAIKKVDEKIKIDQEYQLSTLGYQLLRRDEGQAMREDFIQTGCDNYHILQDHHNNLVDVYKLVQKSGKEISYTYDKKTQEAVLNGNIRVPRHYLSSWLNHFLTGEEE